MGKPGSKRLADAAGDVEFLGSFDTTLPVVELPEIAFVGRSNVGKSSALNALLGQRKAARVSSRPGRTQRINLFRIGGACVFADLPGYGYADVPDEVQGAWKPMIEGYLAAREGLALVVALVDLRVPPQASDTALIHALEDFGVPLLVLGTKVDKLAKHEIKPTLLKMRTTHGLGEDQLVPFSAKSREGVDVVWARLDDALRGD